MEYLATYGWALLVIVIAISVLLYIVPLSPPQVCQLDNFALSCSGQRFLVRDPSTDILNLVYADMTNNRPQAIRIVGMACLSQNSPAPAIEKNNFKLTAFQVPGKGADQPLILAHGETFNTAHVPNNRFKLECFSMDKDGVLKDLTLRPGSTFSGTIYVLYNFADEPANAPASLSSGNFVSSVQ